MSSEASLNDKVSSGRYYMNKIFGRGLERARELDQSSPGRALGSVRSVTIKPDSSGGHLVRVERSSAIDEKGLPKASRVGDSVSTSHTFSKAHDTLQFLSDILSDRPGDVFSGGNEGERLLGQVLNGGKLD